MGLLDDYINSQSYQVLWAKISTPDPKSAMRGHQMVLDSVEEAQYLFDPPGMRGGHQMVLDSVEEVLYLFGGWNGNQDLADLWAYNINASTWTLICNDTSAIVRIFILFLLKKNTYFRA